ncbi:hypothetical protein D3C72_794650 [compost metagenome]
MGLAVLVRRKLARCRQVCLDRAGGCHNRLEARAPLRLYRHLNGVFGVAMRVFAMAFAFRVLATFSMALLAFGVALLRVPIFGMR